jgi:hypothetical protein
MSRPCRAPALAAVLAVVAAGCQDYNFNPVGRCVIQPGTQRVALSNISTADVLFVVDDSGSMGDEQAALADNFDDFINNLNAANQVRADGGLVPIDFHIAVTTSSVYWNFETGTTCRSNCPGAGSQRVCCDAGGPVRRPKRCTSDSQCTVPGTACRLNCSRLQGEFYCCDPDDGSIPPAALTELVTCSREGIMCGTLETHYDFQGCSNNISPNEWPYPRGEFVSFSAVPGGPGATLPNPRVLHFDKELYPNPPNPAATNKQGYTSAELVAWFKENIRVGTCGSGQEQALQAARLAIQKAFARQQKDTRAPSGAPAATAWTAPTPTALNGASASARWPNPNAKLVVVFVGDEDDCSSPLDPSGGVVMLSEPPNADACSRDAGAAPPLGGKQLPVSDFVSYFTGLGRPVAAAFILPAAQNSCTLATCTTGGLCGTAQARGHRLLEAAQALSAAGVEVVAGSICDPDFGSLLDQVAEIVKPPQTLSLPTEPAESRITLLRIASGNGDTRKLCGPPLAPGPYANLGEAQATGADWWFTASKDPGLPFDPTGAATVAVPSKFVYINPDGSCRANPGETYSADYLGVIPEGGCATVDDCTDKLGGQPGAWECFVPPGLSRGTCTCTGAP